MSDPLEELDNMLNDHPADKFQRKDVIKAPFRFHGSKARSLEHLLPHLPYSDIWVDVFGGSGVVTLNRQSSRLLDVWNDRWAGVYAFFKCLRDPEMYAEMVRRLELMPNSKELFYECKNWNVNDNVERAVRWCYISAFSFGGVARNWGRRLNHRKLTLDLGHFPKIRDRMMECQIENSDFRDILTEYDSSVTVFYCDPPYLDSHKGGYTWEMTEQDHIDLLDIVMDCAGFVAVSSYRNNLYDSYVWDEVVSWEFTGTQLNEKIHRTDKSKSVVREEILYIKDVR